jgi:hypothetical protein
MKGECTMINQKEVLQLSIPPPKKVLVIITNDGEF